MLDGGTGNDRLWGSAGRDRCQFSSGIDVIDDGVNEAGSLRNDKTFDFPLVNYALSDLYIYDNSSSGIVITSISDITDGVVDNAVVTENFYSGEQYAVDERYTNDGYVIDMMQFLSSCLHLQPVRICAGAKLGLCRPLRNQ